MTKRLYYTDPYQREFTARILERRPLKQGLGIVLDQTLFYPSSGGQPCDHGTLNDSPILDVFEEGETIIHVLKKDIAGETTQGRIEWARRFDHMQQHTGQHILSAAFEQLGMSTVSFHLGEEFCTIDLNRETVPATEIARAEEIANRIVLENRPLTARYYEPDELAALPLRKAPTKTENIRIVAIQEFDYSPCGGTHCRFSGEVGPIKVRKWERRAAETRIEFLCGWRALRDYGWKHQSITDLANLFSVKDKEVAATVSRLAEEARLQHKALEELQNRVLDYEAAEMRANATTAQGIAFVTRAFPERDQEEVRRLALRLIEREKTVALLGIAGAKSRLILARSPDLAIDMAQLLREIGRVFGGGGGGQPQLAQGGGMDATRLAAALEWATARCQEAIGNHLAGGAKQ